MKYSIFDAHCDTLCLLNDNDKSSLAANQFHIDKKRMMQYKKYTQIFACFIAPEYRSCAMERFMELCDTFYLNKCEGILSIEGAEMITSLKALRIVAKLGVKIIALTWNYANHIAGGVLDKEYGITKFGEQVIKEMNKLNIFLDVSHLNDKSFFEAVKFTEKPIIATHSNSRTVCPNLRNLTDEQFKIIIRSGGCVGINFYPYFLSGNKYACIDDIVRHIEHFMELGGENSVGLGADFDGVECLPDGIYGCEDIYKVLDRLLKLNYTEEQVQKISYKNFENIFKREHELCQSFLQKEII